MNSSHSCFVKGVLFLFPCSRCSSVRLISLVSIDAGTELTSIETLEGVPRFHQSLPWQDNVVRMVLDIGPIQQSMADHCMA